MLQINPFLRPSASELLKCPIFDDIRLKSNEDKAPIKIKLKIDEGEWASRYEEENENEECENTKEQERLILKIIKESFRN
tara:strand:- start:87 stop:326 length:240 start_codon:yes stop_codon:yes gene_type:complete